MVRRDAGGFTVLATEGLVGAGGLDIDAAIVAYLTAVHGGDARWARVVEPATDQERRVNRQLWDDVRAAKESLSRRTSARIPLPGQDDALLGREQLDALARPLVDRTVTACRAALAAAGVRAGDLAGTYLVGGASRYPLVATVLHQALGSTPVRVEQPELTVAEGAVRLAAGPAVEAATPEVRPERRRRVSRRITVLAAGIGVVAVSAAMALVLAPDARTPAGLVAASSTPPPSPTGSPTPTLRVVPGVDPCLVGQWQVVTWDEYDVGLFGADVDLVLVGKGQIVNFLADGTSWNDSRTGVTTGGKAGGNTYRVTHTGTLRSTYRTVDNKLA
ncbi:hypothetical protein Asi02nite_31860 [Asanoa siamensis]|uniref:Hsp70 protein n=1 Tax=Asanoa siamensis TaxID=926357 RepID=A0ABQ4CQU7_9ACTN|nr:hypothetical protein Asi02nite_31860 [Asanoa siamensis]